MDYLPTRKQFLLKNGKIKSLGRGRISGENHAYLLDAFKNGQRFSDWEPEEKVSEKGDKVLVNKQARTRTAPAEIPDEIPIYWPENLYNAVTYVNGKKDIRSMRECCQEGISLVQCLCAHKGNVPRIVRRDGRGKIDVRIERK